MAVGLTPNLAITGLICFVIGYLIASRDLRFPAAMLVAGVKIVVPVIYFSWFFDKTWTTLDDWSYFRGGQKLLEKYNLFEILVTDQGRRDIIAISGGNHILYHWWNALAHIIIAPTYYAPVFLNVMTTFVGGFYLFRIARFSGFSKSYAQGLLIFYLLHWELLTWSSLMNLKDSVVIMLALMTLYGVLRAFSEFKLKWILLVVGTSFTLIWLRIYVPVLVIGAGGAWMFLKTAGKRKWLLLPVALAALWILLPNPVVVFSYLRPGELPRGIIFFALRPQPWSLDPKYSFLLIASILHWIFLIPALAGGLLLWRRSPRSVLILLYAMAIWTLIGMFPELGGPRHRYQIVFAVAWAQYHFLWCLLDHVRSFRIRDRNSAADALGIGGAAFRSKTA